MIHPNLLGGASAPPHPSPLLIDLIIIITIITTIIVIIGGIIIMDEKTMRKIEDCVVETKVKAFCPPTNDAVVKAWEAFDKRVVNVYDPDIEVEIERGSRQVTGIGGAGNIIRGIEVRKGSASPAEELDAWMKVSDFIGDVFPRFSNPDDDRALLLVDEWNDLMDSIADDEEEASPEIRQAAEDQKIVALGRGNGSLKGVEIYDDGVDMDEILRRFGVLW